MPCHYLDGEPASADRVRSSLVKGAPRVVDRRITATAAANANANAALRRPSIIVGLSFRAYIIHIGTLYYCCYVVDEYANISIVYSIYKMA